MSKLYEISIIVPIYNTERYLDRCLKSIVEQTYQNFELILINDGSTDGSGSICDRYADQYDNICAVHNQNQGPAASREEGIKRATGSLIMFVDSDDWLDLSLLSKLYQAIQESDADIVCCQHADIYQHKRKDYICEIEGESLDVRSVFKIMEQIHKYRNLTVSPIARLMRKDLFVNIDFHHDITLGEDYSMIIQLVENANKIRILKEVLYFRQMRDDNLSHSGYTERRKGVFDNYMKFRLELIDKYPTLRVDIIGYHIEYELAVITAMCRNNTYDDEVIAKLVKDLRENLRLVLVNQKIPKSIKMSVVLIAYMPKLFIFLFRILHKMTGR